MLEILKKFFRFCDKRERGEFYVSVVLGVIAALFSALKFCVRAEKSEAGREDFRWTEP